MSSQQHPFDKAWFETNRSTIVAFVDGVRVSIEAGKRHILIKAPVKSGKRVLVEYLAVLFPTWRVKYITSLNRVDVKNQKDELQSYSIATHLTKDERSVEFAIQEVEYDLSQRAKVIVCFDECDYGSGDRQKMARFYKKFLDNTDVVKLYISATAHETEASTIHSRLDYDAFTYVPPPEYTGAQFFLDNKLVFEPHPFFEIDPIDGSIDITDHAKVVVRESVTADRHIGVVRTVRAIPTAALKYKPVRTALERQLQAVNPSGKPWTIRIVDQHDLFNWEDPLTQLMTLDPRMNYLVVIMQTCTRGTDLKGWHHKLAFWHDQRVCDAVNLNTLLQAIRICHYSSDYKDAAGTPQPQKIRLYMDPRIIHMAATDDLATYLDAGGKVPTRTKKGRRPTTAHDGWGVPVRITLPDELLTELLASNTTKTNRLVWTPKIIELIPADATDKYGRNLRELFEGRTFATKRNATEGVKLVHQKFAENEPCRANPGGVMTEDDIKDRTNHFWLDFAGAPLTLPSGETIARDTAYITYGVEIPSEYSSPASTPPRIHATAASMYEHADSVTIPMLPRK